MENDDLTKHKDGPKFKFNNPEDLQNKVDAYFESLKGAFSKTIATKSGDVKTIECDKPATIEGLSLFLDINPSTLWRYKKEGHHPNPEICKIIKRAWNRIASEMFEAGIVGAYDTTFSIFYTKVALGFSDKEHKYEEKEDDKNSTQSRRQEILKKRLEEARRNIEKSKAPEKDENGQ